MSTDHTNASGVTDSSSGTIPEPDKKDTVAYETYRKLLGEKKKRDEELEQAKSKLSELEKAEKERHEAELKAKEDYKALLALKDKEAKDLKSELGNIKGTLEQGAKLRAFMDKVNGVVDEQYWKLIEVDEIKIDPNTGMPDPLSVEAVAKKFEQEYSMVLKTKEAPKTLPNDAAKGAGSAKISYKEWAALKSSKEQKEKQHLVDWSAP